MNTMHYNKHDRAPFPCTNTLPTPNPPFWTTKTAVAKFPQNSGSTRTLRLDKAVHAHDTRDSKRVGEPSDGDGEGLQMEKSTL
jgi:hypothetical protein